MCKITAIANQKGGVGKTTVCQHLAYLMKESHLRVLTVDFDPQANLTASLGPESTPPGVLTISDLLERLLDEEEPPKHSKYLVQQNDVSLILGSKALGKVERRLALEMGTERFLSSVLEPLRASFDHILIDTNRADGPLMANALTAADRVLVPIQAEYYSLEGLSDLVATVLKTKRRINPRLEFEGILISRCKPRSKLYQGIRAEVEDAFGGDIRVFETAIPDTVQVGEAIRRGMTVMEYAPAVAASAAYRAFGAEILM